MSLAIKRKNALTGRWSAINGIQGVDPSMFKQASLEDILREWAGGGEYKVTLKAEGMKPRTIATSIEGAPLDPKPEREQKERMGIVSGYGGGGPGGGGGGGNHGWQNPPMGGWNGPPSMHTPGAYTLPNGGHGYLGGQSAWGNQWGQPQQPQVDPTMQLLIAAMIGNKERSSRDDEDPRLKEMERMIADERRRNEQLMQEMREERRAAEQRQFQEALIARMSEPKKDDNFKDIAAIVAPLLPALLNKEDSTTTAITNAFGGLMQAQANSSTQNLELLKLMMDRPGPDDKMNNMVGAFSNLMSTMSGSMVGVMQNLLAEKPDHPVVQILSQLIEAGAMVGRAAFGGEGGEEEEQYMDPAIQQQIAPPMLGQHDAPIAGLPAHEEPLAGPPTGPHTIIPEPELVAQDEGSEPEGSIEETDDGDTLDISKDHAFAAIFDRIANGGDTKEIAVRLFRHAGGMKMDDPTVGHKIAKAWFTDPTQVGQHIMTQLALPNERIVQVTRAIDEFKAYLRQGGDPDTYAPEAPKRAKRRVSAMDPSLTSDTHGTRFDPDRTARPPAEPMKPVAISEAPAEATADTASLAVPEVTEELEEPEDSPEEPEVAVETPSL